MAGSRGAGVDADEFFLRRIISARDIMKRFRRQLYENSFWSDMENSRCCSLAGHSLPHEHPAGGFCQRIHLYGKNIRISDMQEKRAPVWPPAEKRSRIPRRSVRALEEICDGSAKAAALGGKKGGRLSYALGRLSVKRQRSFLIFPFLPSGTTRARDGAAQRKKSAAAGTDHKGADRTGGDHCRQKSSGCEEIQAQLGGGARGHPSSPRQPGAVAAHQGGPFRLGGTGGCAQPDAVGYREFQEQSITEEELQRLKQAIADLLKENRRKSGSSGPPAGAETAEEADGRRVKGIKQGRKAYPRELHEAQQLLRKESAGAGRKTGGGPCAGGSSEHSG